MEKRREASSLIKLYHSFDTVWIPNDKTYATIRVKVKLSPKLFPSKGPTCKKTVKLHACLKNEKTGMIVTSDLNNQSLFAFNDQAPSSMIDIHSIGCRSFTLSSNVPRPSFKPGDLFRIQLEAKLVGVTSSEILVGSSKIIGVAHFALKVVGIFQNNPTIYQNEQHVVSRSKLPRKHPFEAKIYLIDTSRNVIAPDTPIRLEETLIYTNGMSTPKMTLKSDKSNNKPLLENMSESLLLTKNRPYGNLWFLINEVSHLHPKPFKIKISVNKEFLLRSSPIKWNNTEAKPIIQQGELDCSIIITSKRCRRVNSQYFESKSQSYATFSPIYDISHKTQEQNKSQKEDVSDTRKIPLFASPWTPINKRGI